MSFRIVINHDLQRPQHSHDARGIFIQVFADEVLKHGQLDDAVGLRHADRSTKVADGFGSIAAAADARERRHAGVVPSAHTFLMHQLQQLALAQQSVRKIEAVKLDLLRGKDAQLLDEPVVEGAVIFKFQGADGVRDAFQ